MLEMSNPIIVEFPLRGEWLSPNTPGTKIPSHGTNQLGTRYAHDFIQVDWNRIGNPAYRVGLMQYLFFIFRYSGQRMGKNVYNNFRRPPISQPSVSVRLFCHAAIIVRQGL